MSVLDDIYKIVLENRNAINDMKNKAKQTGDFPIASTLTGNELIRVMQSGVSKYTDSDTLKALGGAGDDNVQSDWNEIDQGVDEFINNKPEKLSDFTDDIGATLGEANVQSDWNEGDTLSDAFINNKPKSLNNIAYKVWFIFKATGNTSGVLEINDLVMGWWSPTVFWNLARYNGGNDTLNTSYTILNSIEDL